MCAGHGYAIFGIDGAGTCYCYSTFNNADTNYGSLCNAGCPGDTAELCGSSYSQTDFAGMLFSAYETSVGVSSYTSLGCYL